MTDDASHDDPPDGLQALLLAGIAGLRTVLDLAERAARDPKGAAQVVNSLATFAKLAFEQVGAPASPAAPTAPVAPTATPTDSSGDASQTTQTTQTTQDKPDDGQGEGD